MMVVVVTIDQRITLYMVFDSTTVIVGMLCVEEDNKDIS